MKIKKNDNVIVITGKDKGKTGTVVETMPKRNKVIVSGVNIKRKSQRSHRSGQKGQVIDKQAPIDVSNVQILDPKDNKPTRVGHDMKDGKKVRVAKRSQSVLK